MRGVAAAATGRSASRVVANGGRLSGSWQDASDGFRALDRSRIRTGHIAPSGNERGGDMRSTRWLAAALVLAGVTVAAAGQWPDKEARDAAVAEVFAKADADGNGALSPQELTTFHT